MEADGAGLEDGCTSTLIDGNSSQVQDHIEIESPAYKRSSRVSLPVVSAVFGCQFIALTAYSWLQYHRFDLGIDFATINQAATEISRGNLDPYSTIVSSSYLDNHFGLILWPIAVLLLVFRSPFVLLLVQNLSLVGTGIIVFAWTSALLASRAIPERLAYGVLVVVAFLLLVNPLVYYSAALDFHLEATATFFAVFSAFDLWSGRPRRAWLWAVLCLLCGDLGGLYVVGVGISAVLAGRVTRRSGWSLVGAGVAWVGLITALHANQGSLLDQYSYLAGRRTLPAGFRGAVAVLGGTIAHPGRPLHVLGTKARMIWRYLPPGGVIGIMTPWGIGVPAIVLLSSALQGNTLFIGEPFQQFAVVPFVLLGSVAVVTALATTPAPVHLRIPIWNRHRTSRRLVAVLLLVVVLLGGVRYAHEYLRGSFTDNATMSVLPASEADALGDVLAHTPADAEVIASGDISGRFSARRHIYVYQTVKGSIPLRAVSVELVMDTAHYPYISRAQRVAAAEVLEERFGARTVLHRDGVWELVWTESRRSSTIVLP